MRMLLLLLLSLWLTSDNTEAGFRAEFNYLISETPSQGGDYRLKGLFVDGDALGFSVDSVNVGYYFYDSRGLEFEIVYSNKMQPLIIEVDRVGHNSAPTTGIGLLTDRTTNISLPYETSKISQKLQSFIESEVRYDIDDSNLLRLADLIDVDTTSETQFSALLYDTTSNTWKAQGISIDKLTDGRTIQGSIFLGSSPTGLTTGINNITLGYGNFLNLTSASNNVGIGVFAGRYSSGGQNVYIGDGANGISTLGGENIIIGQGANGRDAWGQPEDTPNYTFPYRSVIIGKSSRTKDRDADHEIVIGTRAVGNGDRTATIGSLLNTQGTFLHGALRISGYGAGNREAGDTINIDGFPLQKTRSKYLAAFATDGTLLEVDTTGLFGGISGGASDLGSLSDIDTTNKQDGSILVYNSGTSNWEAQANSIDNLTDGYKDGNNMLIGSEPLSVITGANNTSMGIGAGLAITSGKENTNFGNHSGRFNYQGERNTNIGYEANISDTIGKHNINIGAFANSTLTWAPVTGSTNFNQPGLVQADSTIVIGVFSRTLTRTPTNEIVLGSFATGNGSNTATLGNNNITATYLKGTTNLRGYGLGNKEATDLTKTRSAYIAAFATDGTLLELDTTALFGGVSGGGFTLPTDSITFNDNNQDAVAGKLQYDTEYGTLVFGMQNNTPLHIGSDLGWYVVNATGVTIGKGVPVYASGVDGNSGKIQVSPMIANNSIPAKLFLGVTAEAINSGAEGFVWTQGKIRGVDLSAYSQADVLYVSPTSAGLLTATEPAAPNLKLPIGFVVNNTANGTLAIRSTIGNYLFENHDVQISGASSGQVLKYDGTKWVNGTDEIGTDTNLGNADLTMSGTGGIRTATFDNNTLNIEAQGGNINLGNLDINDFSGSYLRLNNSSGNTLMYGGLIYFGGDQTEVAGTTTGGKLQLASYGRGLQQNPDDAYLLSVDAAGFVQEIPVGDYLTSEVDGSVTNEGSLSVTAGASNTSVINSNTSGSTPVTLSASTGLSIGEAGNTITLTNTAPDQTVSLTGAGITAISGTYPNFTITSTEVDGSVTNEGSLSVTAGASNTSVINSNTSGSTPVTLTASTGLTIGESGNTITLTNSAPEATTAGDGLTLDGSQVRLGGTIGTSRTVTLNADNFQFTSSNLDAGYYIDNVSNNFRIYGQALLANYGSGSYTGTVSKILGVTSSGQVVETTVSGGGISLTDLSVTTAAAGASALSYNNTNGVFTFTPPDLSSYLTSEVDGSVTNEGSLSVTAGTGTTSVINSNTSGSAAVTLEASTGLSINEAGNTITLANTAPDQTVSLTGAGITAISGTYPSFTITSTEVDGSVTNEIQDLSLTGNTLSLSGDATTVDLSGYLDDQTVSLTGAGITAISGTYPSFTITSTEVDGSTSNEGALSASTLVSGSIARLTSNTNGGSNVDFSAGTGIAIGSTGGNTISITNSLPEATTASNGLTETGNNIALGGTLNSSTVLTLPTDGTFTIANTGGDGTGFTINEGIDATVFTGLIAGTDYGSGTREAADISKTNSAYFARFATDGTVVESTALTSEVDGSVTNEGVLSIGTGVVGSSVFIQSNTSTSTPVTISVGDGFDIAASGSTIFLNPEAYAIQSGTSGAISWGSAPQRIHVLDFGANTSITLSFTNVAIGGIYTLRVTGNSGTDTLIWPASAKLEDGTSAGTVTLQNGGQMFTFYWDGTNYWVK